ncbi:hypothetical protein DIPPA_26925 [Diplonema papillatum]|nr:hypothetical protein DIPPA_26925 [Diplonema papillatum]
MLKVTRRCLSAAFQESTGGLRVSLAEKSSEDDDGRPRFVPVNPRFKTKDVDSNDWKRVAEAWVPEQTELAQNRFRAVFQEYFEGVNKIGALDRWREVEDNVREKRLRRIDDSAASDLLVACVMKTQDKYRGDNVSSQRKGDGWSVPVIDVKNLPFDQYCPLKVKDNLTDKDIRETLEVRSRLLAHPQLMGGHRLFEADLLTLSVLLQYTDEVWPELSEKITHVSRTQMDVHPCTMEFVLDGLLKKWRSVSSAARQPARADSATHDSFAKQRHQLRMALFMPLEYLAYMNQRGRHTFPKLMHPHVARKLLQALPEVDYTAILEASSSLVTDPGVFIVVVGTIAKRLGPIIDDPAHARQQPDAPDTAPRQALATYVRSSVIPTAALLHDQPDSFFDHPLWETEEGYAATCRLFKILTADLPARHPKDVNFMWKLAVRLAIRFDLEDWALDVEPFLSALAAHSRRYQIRGAVSELVFARFFEKYLTRADFPWNGASDVWRTILTLSTVLCPAHVEGITDTMLVKLPLLQQTHAAGAHASAGIPSGSVLSTLVVKTDPVNFFLQRVASASQALEVLQALPSDPKQRPALSRETFLHLFPLLGKEGLWEEAQETLVEQCLRRESHETQIALTMRVAQVGCSLAHFKSDLSKAQDAVCLLEDHLVAWAAACKSLDDGRGQYRDAKPVLQKILPRQQLEHIEAIVRSMP